MSIWSSITILSSRVHTGRLQGHPRRLRIHVDDSHEHLRAVDANISERTATAMLYDQVRHVVLQLAGEPRLTTAFSYLSRSRMPRSYARWKAQITMDRLDYVLKATWNGRMTGGLLRVPGHDAQELHPLA